MNPTNPRPAVWQPPATPNYVPSTITYAPAQRPAAPTTELQFFRYANVGKRFVALLIDSMILGAMELLVLGVLYGTSLALGYLLGDLSGAIILATAAGFLTMAIAFAIPIVYFVKGETGPDEGTIGKRILGIKVVTTEGNRLSSGQSLGRFLSRFLSSLFFCFGYLMALFTEKKQALHDMIAGTIVVER